MAVIKEMNVAKREEILDMAVHALTPLMKGRGQASAEELFDDSLQIGEKLVAKVEETAKDPDAPPRDELMDMGIHALSALLNGRQPDRVEDVLEEAMDVARALIAKVDEAVAENAEADREELLDAAVHVQTALLTSRPQVPASELANQCVAIATGLIDRVDRDLA